MTPPLQVSELEISEHTLKNYPINFRLGQQLDIVKVNLSAKFGPNLMSRGQIIASDFILLTTLSLSRKNTNILQWLDFENFPTLVRKLVKRQAVIEININVCVCMCLCVFVCVCTCLCLFACVSVCVSEWV